MTRSLGLAAAGAAALTGLVAGCDPPPASDGGLGPPPASVTLRYTPAGVEVPLVRDGADLVLDLMLAADLEGLAFVPPSEEAPDVAGEGHVRFEVNGAVVDAPDAPFFSYRSEPGVFAPGDRVQFGVEVVSNTGQDLGLSDLVEVDLVAPADDAAAFRLVHAAASLGRVDVYVADGETPLVADLAFGDATPFAPFEAAPLRVDVRPAGASASSPPLFTDFVDLAPGQRVSGIAADPTLGAPAQAARVLPVVEDWGNDVAGRARVRFVHAGADLPPVEVDGLGPSAPTVAPFDATARAGITLDIDGGVSLSLTDAADGAPITRFTSPELVAGDEILLVAAGRRDSLAREPDGLQLLAIGTDGPLDPILQDPEVYVLHGSGDAARLELCSDALTQPIAADVAFGEMVRTRIPPATYNLEIFGYPAGCTGAALNGEGNVTTFEPGERYLVLLTGEETADEDEASIQAAAFRDDFTLGDAVNARVQFVHGASYTQVYVGAVVDGIIAAPDVFTAPIAWRVASVEVPVPPGAYTLGVADADGTPPPPYTPIVSFDYAAFGGERQWGIVAGDPTPDDADDGFLQVLVVDSAPDPWTVGIVDVR